MKAIVIAFVFCCLTSVSLDALAQYNGPNFPVGPVINDVTDDATAIIAGKTCLQQLKVNCSGNFSGNAVCVQVICACNKAHKQMGKKSPARKKAAEAVEKGVEAAGNDRSGDIDKLLEGLKQETENRKSEDKRIEAKLDDHIDNECHDGERRCTDENTPAVCKDGAWVDEEDCEADEYCNDGLCMEKPEVPDAVESRWQASPVFALGAVLSAGPKAFLASAGLRLETPKVLIDATAGAGATFDSDTQFAFGANLSVEAKLAPIFRLGGAIQYAHANITDETQLFVGVGPKVTVGAPDDWKVRPEFSLSGGIAGVSQYVETSRDAESITYEPDGSVGWWLTLAFNLGF